ncbi:MAG: FHA domain-containing protein [Leptolyngbyaceae cyanobacterium MAG.088]|nr:FHA domain-containing protein [Leptolyngbyaceae cyanobacterium MAG.088]
MITLSLLHPLNKTPIQNWSFEEQDVIRIGRSTDNDVVLYSAVVSRHHLEIHKGVAGWALQSIGTNGTYLDGKRIKHVTAEDGLVVRLARSGPNLQISIDQPEKSSAASIKELLARRKQQQFSVPRQPVRTDLDVVQTDIRDRTPLPENGSSNKAGGDGIA